MIWDALFHTPEGWLAIAVTVVSLVVAWGLKSFISRKIKQDEAAERERRGKHQR